MAESARNSTGHKKQPENRRIWYWIRVIFLIAGGIAGGHWLNEKGYGFTWRCWVYQSLHNLNPHPSKPRRTVLVLIGDEEYWKGEAESRSPIKRDYLAKLVQAADAYNPALIALDFDLRSPSPEGNPVEVPLYQGETNQLLEAVKVAAHKRTVVLSKTLGGDEEHGYVALSDIYNGFNFDGGNLRFGYIALPDDTRQVPLTLHVTNGPPVESFSQAIARADDSKSIPEDSEATSLPYGSYVRTEEFTIISANDLLSKEPEVVERVKSNLAFKLVIIGGRWHTLGYNGGPLVDSYETPVGNIPGVFIHANYAEALLNSRIFRTWKGWALNITEAIVALLVAIPFVLRIKPWWKNLIVITLPYLIIIAISYISLVNFGLFFDPSIPLIIVGAHGVFEQVNDWRKGARKSELNESEEAKGKMEGKEEPSETIVEEIRS